MEIIKKIHILQCFTEKNFNGSDFSSCFTGECLMDKLLLTTFREKSLNLREIHVNK